MANISSAPSSSTILRWTMLIVLLANVAFIADYSNLSDSPTIADVVAKFGPAFVPALFAQAIGVAIPAGFLLFFVAALWPRRHRARVYDTFVAPLALASVLASGWIVAFRHENIGLSGALVAASVALAGLMFVRVASVSPSQHSPWLRAPFSLYFAAMTLALLVALTQWMSARGLLTHTTVAPDDLAAGVLVVAAVAGGFVALRYSDFVYPAVIAAGGGAMFIAQRAYDPEIAADALIVCVGMLVVVGLAAVALAQRSRRDSGGKARAELARRAQDERWYLIEANSSIMRL